MRSDELRFGVIGRTRIHRCVQVASFHKNPVRCAGVRVAGVTICSRWEDAGEGIHPGARTQVSWTCIYARGVSIRASHAKMSAARSGSAAKAASVVLQSEEPMRQPGLANLLKAIVVGRSTAHAIEILRHDRMVGIWHRKKIQFYVSVIARVRSHRQANLGSATAELLQRGQLSHDDIRSRVETFRSIRCRPRSRTGRAAAQKLEATGARTSST